MSKRVVIISLLLCLIGLWGIWNVIASWLDGHILFNTCVLFFHPGYGLMLGRRWARTAASWAFGFFYAGLVFILTATGISPETAAYSGMPAQFGYSGIFVVALISLAVALLLHWQLYTRPFEEHLAESPLT